MKPIIKVCLRQWPLVCLSLLLALAAAWMDQLVPRMLKELPHIIEHNGLASTSLGFLATSAAYAIGAQLIRIVQRVLTDKAAAATEARLTAVGVARILDNSLTWHISNHVAQVHVRLIRSTNAIAGLLKIAMMDVLGPILGLVFTFAVLLETSRYAAYGMLGVALLVSAVTVWQLLNQNGVRIDINRKKEDIGAHIVNVINGIEQVKIFDARQREIGRTSAIAGELADREYTHHVAMGKFDALKAFFERGGVVAVLGLSMLDTSVGLQVGQIGGTLLAVLLCADRFLEPLRGLHRIIDEFGEKLALARDFIGLEEALHQRSPARREGDGRLRLLQRGVIAFNNVSFRYHDKEFLLRNASASFPSGSRVAVIGPTGCGKSTVGRMLCGLLTPDQGTIAIDGYPVRPIEMASSPRHLVGMLTQETHLIPNETVLENIRLGREGATDVEVLQAAKKAGVGEELLIEAGKPRRVTANSQGFSGGQKQRIGLARLLLQAPSIVILDEPTSAQDIEHKDRFFDHVIGTLKHRSLFVITHDRERLDWATHIMEIRDGQFYVREQCVCSVKGNQQAVL